MLHVRRVLRAVGRWTANFFALLIVLAVIAAVIFVGFPLVLVIVALAVLFLGALRISHHWRG